MGHSPCHVKNSVKFINIKSLHASPENILVSFDVFSLFTMVPIGEALHLLSWHSNDNILKLFHHVLPSTFFRFNRQLYEQTEGVAMSSPLSSVITNFFMEQFEETTL
jgi:hypothetical protein